MNASRCGARQMLSLHIVTLLDSQQEIFLYCKKLLLVEHDEQCGVN